MKKLVLLLLCSALTFANDKKTASVIKEVVVYLNGAQITREATVTIPGGNAKILLSDLSPLIDENSIQISGLKNTSVLSVNYNINYLEKETDSEKILALEKTLRSKNKELTVLQHLIKGLEEEEKLLSSNKDLKSQQQSVSLAKVMEFSKYFRERIAAIGNEIYDARQNIDAISKEIQDLNKELSQLKDSNKERRGEILVKVDAPSAATLQLTVKYNVSEAGWFPVYDIKAENTRQPLSFYYKAHVYQQTGSDWKDVKITLSTGDPTVNNSRPEVDPHYLNFVNPYAYRAQNTIKRYNYKYNPMVRRVSGRVTDADGVPLPGVNVVIKGTSTGTQTDFDGKYNIDITAGQELVFSYIGQKSETIPIYSNTMNVRLEEDATELEEVVVTGYATKRKRSLGNRGFAPGLVNNVEDNEITATGDVKRENITNTVFKIVKKYSIPSVSDVTVIEIDNFNTSATYEYFTAPVLNENVFLTAKLKQWEQFDLLPGEANVYFEENYAGKTFIDPFQTEDELVISLGIDPNVVVERKQRDNLKSRSFIGGTRIIDKAYEISVKNSKNTAIDLVVMDRIPISQNKEIKVDDVKYGDAKYDNKKGLLRWKLTLKSNESVKKQLSYQLKYPRNKRINHQ